MTEQDILQLRDLAEAGQVQFKERIVSKDDKYEIGCEMVAFSNSRGGRLPYTGAGSGVRRALEYDPNAIFSNGVDQREITHSSNEFVITIPRKYDSVSDQALRKNDPVQTKTDPVSDQPTLNTTELKLTKKQQDIRNFCNIPRNRQEILQRAGVSDHFDNRKKYICDLVEAGVLERTIPDKPNDPNQKYRRKQ